MTGTVSSDCSAYSDCWSGFKTEGAGGEDTDTDNGNKNTVSLKPLHQNNSEKSRYPKPVCVATQIVGDTNELFVFLVVLGNLCNVK